MELIKKYGLEIFFENKDYTEIKAIEGNVDLRQFISGMLCYNPRWLGFLYKVREIFVNILGLEKAVNGMDKNIILPEDVPFNPGENAHFFIINKALENQFWVCETPKDKHLKAYLGIIEEKLNSGNSRFYVFTTIDYLHWTGPFYFNLIRGFHHIVVNKMMKAGIKSYL